MALESPSSSNHIWFIWTILRCLSTWIQQTLQGVMFLVMQLLSPSVMWQNGVRGLGKQLCLQQRIPNLCTLKKKKKSPRNFLSLTLEKLELIMRLLHLDSLGKGMLHVLKVSAVDWFPRGSALSRLSGVKWMLLWSRASSSVQIAFVPGSGGNTERGFKNDKSSWLLQGAVYSFLTSNRHSILPACAMSKALCGLSHLVLWEGSVISPILKIEKPRLRDRK